MKGAGHGSNDRQALCAARLGRGYSQETFAGLIGVSRQAVSKWERGESSPDTDSLVALARLYGMSLDDLVFDERAGTGESTRLAFAGAIATTSPDTSSRAACAPEGAGTPAGDSGAARPLFRRRTRWLRAWADRHRTLADGLVGLAFVMAVTAVLLAVIWLSFGGAFCSTVDSPHIGDTYIWPIAVTLVFGAAFALAARCALNRASDAWHDVLDTLRGGLPVSRKTDEA